MENKSNIIVEPKQIIQLVGVGFFMCMSLLTLSNILETLFSWVFNFTKSESFYLFVLSQCLSLTIALLVFYVSLKKIKKVIIEQNSFLKNVLVFMIIIYVTLYVISTLFPILYDFLKISATDGETNSYFEMRMLNQVESLVVYYSSSIIKLIVIAFVFLKEYKNASFYPKTFSEDSKILDKD